MGIAERLAIQRLRELSMNYIREAERLKRKRVATRGQANNLRSPRCDSPRRFRTVSLRAGVSTAKKAASFAQGGGTLAGLAC